MNLIQSTFLNSLPYKRKTTKKGWISFNSKCCVHNNETVDTRGRGGVIFTPEGGLNYHCFNCQYTTGWNPGWHLSYKMRKLMSWMGLDENDIQRLVFEALKIREDVGVVEVPKEEFKLKFNSLELPEGSKLIKDLVHSDVSDDLLDVIKYGYSRKLTTEQIQNMYWTPNTELKMHRRLIIPFTWENKIIGYTARSIDKIKIMRYYNQYDPNYVYGIDKQPRDSKFVLVTEGVFDAIPLNGVAVLTNTINDVQAEIIERLGKEIIVVPDRDKSGELLIQRALEYGWFVSFPEWAHGDVKDVNRAIQKYGKIFTLKKILLHKEKSKLKIELLKKKYIWR